MIPFSLDPVARQDEGGHRRHDDADRDGDRGYQQAIEEGPHEVSSPDDVGVVFFQREYGGEDEVHRIRLGARLQRVEGRSYRAGTMTAESRPSREGGRAGMARDPFLLRHASTSARESARCMTIAIRGREREHYHARARWDMPYLPSPNSLNTCVLITSVSEPGPPPVNA